MPLILLLGLFIGAWAPNEELRVAKKEVAELNKKLADREKDSRVDAFTRMMQIPDRAKKINRAAPPVTQPAAPIVAAPLQAEDTPLPSPVTNQPPSLASRSEAKEPDLALAPEDLRARIDEAKELWKTRVDIARAQWIDRLKLTPEAAALFDTSINTMNEELYSSMQSLADALAANETLTPELGTRFFNEMTTSLVKTYDDLDGFVPDTQRGEAAQLELTDFIDPAVAEPLVAVQGKLENIPPQSGRRGPRFLQ